MSARATGAGNAVERLRDAVGRRLGRSRTERGAPPAPGLRADDPVSAAEAQRRIEAARARLKASIPPPDDDD